MNDGRDADRKVRVWRLLVAAGVLFFAAATHASTTLSLAECRLQSGGAGASVAARCGTFAVPEDPTAPGGRTIGLKVAVVPALKTRAEPDPLFVISGGPGQAASDFYVTMAQVFARIRRDRDIVIVDQRGTGGSNRLSCPLPNDVELTVIDAERVGELAKRCLEELPGDPRFYTTSIAVADLDRVRAALGYERINLYGISYGTRVAQHYARRHPERVRAMILDGVVPPQLALGPQIPVVAQQALDALFDRCAADAACRQAFPDVREQFARLHARLRESPLEVPIADPINAAPIVVRLGLAELNGAVRLLSYSDETAATLPLLIHQAEAGKRPQALAAQYEMIRRDMQAQLAYGMHFSVICSEDAPRWSGREVERETLEATYMGSDFMTVLSAVCAVWPRGPVDADFYEPLRSDAPTLLLSGENDPVTPPAYAEEIRPGLANSLHLVLRGQGHGQLAAGCVPRLIAELVASGSLRELDAECAAKVTPAPFLLSLTGAAP